MTQNFDMTNLEDRTVLLFSDPAQAIACFEQMKLKAKYYAIRDLFHMKHVFWLVSDACLIVTYHKRHEFKSMLRSFIDLTGCAPLKFKIHYPAKTVNQIPGTYTKNKRP